MLATKRRPLHFDHILAYRPGTPILPLLNFHDAFRGGELHLSGLYEEETVQAFCQKAGADFLLKTNPEIQWMKV